MERLGYYFSQEARKISLRKNAEYFVSCWKNFNEIEIHSLENLEVGVRWLVEAVSKLDFVNCPVSLPSGVWKESEGVWRIIITRMRPGEDSLFMFNTNVVQETMNRTFQSLREIVSQVTDEKSLRRGLAYVKTFSGLQFGDNICPVRSFVLTVISMGQHYAASLNLDAWLAWKKWVADIHPFFPNGEFIPIIGGRKRSGQENEAPKMA